MSEDIINKMFKLAKIDREIYYSKLDNINKKYLQSKYRPLWDVNKSNRNVVTTGYCFLTTLALHYFVFNSESQIMRIKDAKKKVDHFYILNDQNIIDLTADQFDFPLDYSKGMRIDKYEKFEKLSVVLKNKLQKFAKQINLNTNNC